MKSYTNFKSYLILLLACIGLAYGANAQSVTTVTFVGKSSITDEYIRLHRVGVFNNSQHWEEILYYPDTTLQMQASTGIEEVMTSGSVLLLQNVPNPFDGVTDFALQLEHFTQVEIEIYDINGRKVTGYNGSLDAGQHQFRATLTSPQTYLLSAQTSDQKLSIKMINEGHGADNSIIYLGSSAIGGDVSFGLRGTQLHSPLPFVRGDQMTYVGYTQVENDEYVSATVQQQQWDDELIALMFNISSPIVATRDVTVSTASNAMVSSEVLADGNLPVTARGVCYSTSPYPTIADSHTTNGSGVGTYNANLHNLQPHTTYHVRAYATNALGTAYGRDLSFNTKCKSVTDVDGITYHAVQIGEQCWMREGLRTDIPGNSGFPNNNDAWESFGRLYSWNTLMNGSASSNANPSNVQGICPDGWHVPSDAEWSQLAEYLQSLSYYWCGESSNSIANALAIGAGWAYSFVQCTPGNEPSANNLSGFSAAPGGYSTGSAYSNVNRNAQFWSSTASTGNNAYFYDIAYDNESLNRSTCNKDYRLSVRCVLGGVLPRVTTADVDNVMPTTATSGGEVLSDGGESVTARGVCWSTSQNPTTADSHTTDGSGTGSFSSSITGLTPNTTYYVRAYATNSVCTSYGEEKQFRTMWSSCGIVTDIDGNTYSTVEIGEQCWMRENLRTDVPGNNGYPNNDANNWEYGRLYSWGVMMNGANSSAANPSGVQGICPDGWHVPSDAEWTQLTDYVSSQSEYCCDGNSGNIAKALASVTGWNSSGSACAVGNGPSSNNATGFSALPAGYYYGSYDRFGNFAYFGSATELSSDYAYYRRLYYNFAGVYRYNNNKTNGYSVRCVRGQGCNPVYGETSAAACETYTWHGQTYTQSGDYTWTGQTANGCDSIVTLHLTINESVGTTEELTICESDLPYTYNDTVFEVGTPQFSTFNFQFSTSNGCDSVSTLHLTINQPTAETLNVTVTENSLPYHLNGYTYNAAGSYTQHLTNAAGCDSTLTLNLTVLNNVSVSVDSTICDGDLPLVWNGMTFNNAGSQSVTLTSANNTDSVVLMTLHVNASAYASEEVTLCESQLPLLWHGQTYTQSGDYTWTGTTSNGCDSIVTLHLTINNPTHVATTVTECESYVWNGTTYTQSGNYTFSHTDANGCTQVDTLHLTINPMPNVTISGNSTVNYGESVTLTASGADSYHWNTGANTASITVAPTAATTYSVTGTTDYGCTGMASKTVTVSYLAPTVTTADFSNYNYTSVTSGGEVTSDGGANVTARGVCWSTSQNPTIAGSHTTDGSGTGSFSSSITGLTPNTTYYVRAYATNSVGTSYGEEKQFRTWQSCGTVTDIDNNTYSTIQIGDQCWMRENLRTTKYADNTEIALGSGTSNDVAYRYYPNNDEANVSTYGYLYNWRAVMGNSSSSNANPSNVQGICPDGWHVPSDAEWTRLTDYVSSRREYCCDGNSDNIAKALASVTGWYGSDEACTVANDPGSNNATGFSALPAGSYYGSYNDVGFGAYFWGATEHSSDGAYARYLGYSNAGVGRDYSNEANGFSVRCVRGQGCNPVHGETSAAACETYTWHGQTYTQSGDYTWTGTISNGCDSIVTLHLTINNPTHVATTVTECESYVWNGTTYTQSGNYTFSHTDANGCTQVDTLHLTINQPTAETLNVTVTENSLPYHLNGYTYNAAGSYTQHLTNANGCDSTLFVNLTVLNNVSVSVDSTICDGDLPLVWNGMTFNNAGSQSVTLTSANNTDSVVLMTLHVNASAYANEEVTLCESQLPFSWHGQTYTESGDYTWTGQTANGCDSIVTLHLTINNPAHQAITVTECESYAWNGTTYTQSGHYTYSHVDANGCTQVDTLHLTILPTTVFAHTADTIVPAGVPTTLWTSGANFILWKDSHGNVIGEENTITVYPDTITTYSVIAYNTGANLVTNGDFEQGNTGFSTSYIFANTGNYKHYFIGQDNHQMWSWDEGVSISDHTSASGNWMMVDAYSGYTVWEQTVNVQPNTDYIFSAWFVTDNIANVRFNISDVNGELFSTPEERGIWRRYHLLWNSGENTTARLRILSGTASSSGNDFGVDDISFAPITTCEKTEVIFVTTLPAGDALPCMGHETVTDIDGNTYNTVQIGDQCWMRENLRTTRYADNSGIALGNANSYDIAYRYIPNNNSQNIPQYGYLYNWAAVMHGGHSNNDNPSGVQGICPDGWHVPSSNEWDQLISYVSSVPYYCCNGNSSYIVKALASQVGWNYQGGSCSVGSDLATNNLTGFSAMPACYFYDTHGLYFGRDASFWSCTQTGSNKSRSLRIYSPYSSLYYDINLDQAHGLSVRCIRGQGCNPVHSETSAAACETYTWHGTTYTQSGDYTWTGQTSNGCDSIVTLHLTINRPTAETLNVTATENSLPYHLNGYNYNAAGSYTQPLTNAAGCDSTLTLNLTVLNNVSVSVDSTICDGELPLIWNGMTFNNAGSQSVTLTSANNTDSVVLMTLHVNASAYASEEATLCESQLPFSWHGQTYTQSGDYTWTGQTANGCDSIVTLHLIIFSQPNINIEGLTDVCVGGQVTLTANVQNADGVSTYLWYRDSIGIYVSPEPTYTTEADLPVGSYLYSVEVANNICFSTTSIVVTVHPAPEIVEISSSLQPSNQMCVGGTVDLHAPAIIHFDAADIQWHWFRNGAELYDEQIPAISQTLDILGTYAYMVYVTQSGYDGDIPGCQSAPQHINIDVLPQPVWGPTEVTSTDGCLRSWVELRTSIIGGVQDDAYIVWHSAPANAPYDERTVGLIPLLYNDVPFWDSLSSPGRYIYWPTYENYSNNNCWPTNAPSAIAVTVHEPSYQTITESACGSYTWNGQTYTQSGDYTWTGQTSNGCDSIVTLHLTIHPMPNVQISGNSSVNYGESVTLTASGADSYYWNTGANTASVTVAPTAATTYSVTGTTAYGCTGMASKTVTVNYLVPTVTTAAVSNITANSAACGGNVTSDGGANVTARGVCWSTSPNPTTADAHTFDGTGMGNFASSLTWLENETTYYVRAYAANCVGVGYGEEFSFTTLQGCGTDRFDTLVYIEDDFNDGVINPEYWTSRGNAVVEEDGLLKIQQNVTDLDTRLSSVNLPVPQSGIVCVDRNFILHPSNTHGNYYYPWTRISFNGDDNSYVGVQYWNTTYGPDSPYNGTSISSNIDGSQTRRVIGTATYNTNIFEHIILDFNNGTVTYYQDTLVAIVSIPNLSTHSVDYFNVDFWGSGWWTGHWVNMDNVKIYALQPTVHYDTTNLYYTSCESYEWHGQTYTESGDYTWTGQTSNGCDSIVTLHLTINPMPNVQISGNSSVNYGESVTLTASGADSYHWNTGANTASITVAPTAAITYSVTGTTAAGCTGTASKTVTVNYLAPTVTTADFSNYNYTSVTSGGNVTSDGGTNVTARGVCWSTSHNPTIAGSHTTDGSGTGSFSSNIAGLSEGTTYYVRAYATNSVGTSYGEEKQFRTWQSCGTVTDVDGNTYNTVQIGDQCWMRENLRTTKYADNTEIALGSGTSNDVAYRYYPNNDEANVSTYGYLYNWRAVMGNSSSSNANPSNVQGICPDGWHVPSDAEWTQLTDYVSSQSSYCCSGNTDNIAKALASTTGWDSYTGSAADRDCYPGYNSSGNNATGFSALPAGFYNGSYNYFVRRANFWSATESNSTRAYSRYLTFNDTNVFRYYYGKSYGYSVRCVRGQGCNPVYGETSASACGSYTWHGQTYTQSGDYTWTGQTSNGCDSIVTLHLTIHPMPNVQISGNSSVNYGESVTLTASGADSYHWNTGANTASVTVAPTATTTYSVTGTTAYGCTGTASINVEVNEQTLNDGLVLYLPMNGDLMDVSGFANNGTNNGASLTTDRFCQPNSAYEFPGVPESSKIIVPNNSSLQFSDAATFSMWFCMNGTRGMDGWGGTVDVGCAHALFSKNSDMTCIGANVSAMPNGEFHIGSYSGRNSNSAGDTCELIQLNQWVQATFVFTTSYMEVYVNGELLSHSDGSMNFGNSNSKDLSIGLLMSTWYPFNGKIDEFRVYNRALNASEIAKLYYRDLIPKDSLVLFIPLDGNVIDHSDNNYQPVLHGNLSVAGDRFGVDSSAYHFPNDYQSWIEIPHTEQLNLSGTFTVSAWYKRAADGAHGNILGKGRDAESGWQLGTAGVSVNGSAGYSAGIQDDLAREQWYMTTGVMDATAGKLRYYLNGELMAETNCPNFSTNTTFPLAIGRHLYTMAATSSFAYPFKGEIDDIVIYHRALSDDEVMMLYNSNSHALPACEDPILCQDTNVYIEESACGSYTWLGQTYTQSGDYTWTGQTSNGCDSIVTLHLTINPMPNVQISGNSSVNYGESVTLTASGADSYYWNTGANTAFITVAPTAAITYSVTGTTAAGCTGTASKTVTVNYLAPTVTTADFSNYNYTSVTSGGEVTADGGANVTARGVCWSISQNPTVSGSHTTDGSGTGSFSSAIAGLNEGTTYYVRAYATNSVGTSYGEEKQFRTWQSCGTVTDIDGNSYNTVQIGEQCWMRENLRTDVPGNNGYPNGDANNWEYGRLYSWDVMMNGAASSGSNPSWVQGICPEGWHVPSDAEWTQLTDYVSSQSEFVCGGNGSNIAKALASTTGWSGSSYACAVGNTPSSNNATGFSALPAGYYVGSYNYFGTYAFFWSATELLSSYAYGRYLRYNNPYVNRNNDGKNYGFSVRCLRGQGCNPVYGETSAAACGSYSWHGQTYTQSGDYTWTGTTANGCDSIVTLHLTIHPMPNVQISGSSSVNYGESVTLTASGADSYIWSTGSMDNPITVSPTSTTTYNVIGATTYGCTGTASKTVTVNPVAPTVTTTAVSNITTNSATSGGNVTSNGGANVTARGVCWSTSQNPAVSNSHTTDGSGTGSFSSSITGLTLNTTYYVRAYATNSVGTSYGEEKQFRTANLVICPNDLTLSASAFPNSVVLNWAANIPTEIITDTLSYHYSRVGGAGSEDPISFVMGMRFPVDSLNNLNNHYLTHAGVYLGTLPEKLSLNLYECTPNGDNVSIRQAYSQNIPISSAHSFSYNVFSLTCPYQIDASKELMIGFELDNVSGGCIQLGEGVNPVYSNLINLSGWTILDNVGLDGYSWIIDGYFGEYSISYRVFRDGTEIASSVNNGTYVDFDVAAGSQEYCYQIEAVCNGNTVSNTVCATTLPQVDGLPCVGNPIITDYDANTYSTVQIGEQCWMRENMRTTHYTDGTPISVTTNSYNISTPYAYYPDNNPANASTYGLLYNWRAAMGDPELGEDRKSVCPTGWHIPSEEEVFQLNNYLRSNPSYWCGGNSSYVSHVLAANSGWNTSTTQCAPGFDMNQNNATNLSIMPSGYAFNPIGGFGGTVYMWTSDEVDENRGAYYEIAADNPQIGLGFWANKSGGLGVRCLRDPFTCGTSTVTDIDGNSYNTVQIGEQCWMRENLRTNVPGNNGYPNNDANNWEYGRLYSWDVMMNGASSSAANPSGVQGICPDGWHVPSDAEWTRLTDYVSSQSEYCCDGNSGNIAKALASTSGWSANGNACAVGNDPSSNNATGFSALPAGSYNGSYYYFGNRASFWSATEVSSDCAYYRGLYYNNAGVYRINDNNPAGYSVRCVRD